MPLVVKTLYGPPRTLKCPCCQGQPPKYLPIPAAYVEECQARGVEHPLDAWETLNLESYLCPLCGATDRDRLQLAFLDGFLSETSDSLVSSPNPVQSGRAIRALEIAPSPPVSNWLRNRPGIHYRSADLFMPNADDQVEVTDMGCYSNAAFDLVICSHVLEHIPDDRRAMREIRRVLSPNGIALLLVPISTIVDGVVEDRTLLDEAERWRRFGQGDHVRIYNRSGFVARLEEAGFAVEIDRPAACEEVGLSPSNCLYIGRPKL